jgi:DNA-binding IclR family transcriptional regulator
MVQNKVALFNNRSLERALSILCAFSKETQSLSLAQLSEAVKLPKTTVLRLCSTLTEFGFLYYDQQAGRYSLGLKLLVLGSVVNSTFFLTKVASPYLDELQTKTGKTIFLAIFHQDEIVYIDKKEDPKNQVRFASEVGTRRPPYFGMFGQIFMAHLPEPEVDRILEKHPLAAVTRKSITDPALFKEKLCLIRNNGFLIEEGEAIDGVTGISAPVLDFSGKPVAAVGVSFISSSEDENGKSAIIKEALDTAREISRRLGYTYQVAPIQVRISQ